MPTTNTPTTKKPASKAAKSAASAAAKPTASAASTVPKPEVTEHHQVLNIPDHGDIKVTTKTTVREGQKPRVTVKLDADDIVREQVGGFITFLREHAIVGLAVGFIIGQQAQGVVKQIVASFVDPMIQLLIGGAKLSDRVLIVHLFHNEGKFGWGAMVYILLNLLFVLLTIYILVKVLKLDKLDKPKA